MPDLQALWKCSTDITSVIQLLSRIMSCSPTNHLRITVYLGNSNVDEIAAKGIIALSVKTETRKPSQFGGSLQ